jgi:AcrR family transcriptional regulator
MRERLLAAAVECICDVGYADATTTLIAERARVSRGALQHHFASKAELIEAVIDRVAGDLNLRFDVATLAAAPLEQRVALVCDHYWDVFMGASFRAVLSIAASIAADPALSPRLSTVLDFTRAGYGAVWLEIFHDTGRTDEELTATRRIVMSAARGFGVLKLLQPRVNLDRDRKAMYALALRELRGPR